MWLAANQKPDFRTINAFRGERLKSVIEEVFTATVKLLYEKGYVKLKRYEQKLPIFSGKRVNASDE